MSKELLARMHASVNRKYYILAREEEYYDRLSLNRYQITNM